MVVTSERLQKLTMGRVTWSKAVFLDDPLFSSSVVADLFWCPRFLRTIFGFPCLASQFYYGILNAYILCYDHAKTVKLNMGTISWNPKKVVHV